MKLIASNSRNTFIAEISEDEVANILGFDYASGSEYRDLKIGIGSTVKISPLFRYLREVRNFGKKMKSAAATIRSLADLLEPIDPIEPAPVDEVTP